MIVSITSNAQWVPMQYGQPFPFRVGIALSKETADSTKQFVDYLRNQYLHELEANKDLTLNNEFLKNQYNYKIQGYEGLQTQVINLQTQNAKLIRSRKRRFWIGVAIGTLSSTAAYFVIPKR